MRHYCYSSFFLFSSLTLFDWHKQLGALERLTPPWQKITVLNKKGHPPEKGSKIKIFIKLGKIKLTAEFEHTDYQEGRQFTDQQVQGPFKSWQHTHLVQSRGQHQSEMVELIDYQFSGAFFLNSYFKKQLNRLFAYRHQTLRQDLLRHQKVKPMKILISGASGLIGSALVPFLTSGKHQVIKLVHKKGALASDEIAWASPSSLIKSSLLEGFDAVIHLAGESLKGRWNQEKKRKIKESRVQGTQELAQVLSQLKKPPSVFICSSAIGYYGDRGNQVLTEESSKGTGFLAEVCKEWEQASLPAYEAGIRTVNLRTGIVLSPQGGALEQMLTPFKLGLGAKIGSGNQYMSWIAIDDLIYILYAVLQNASLSGPVNAVSPYPLTNKEFTKVLAFVLKRPVFLTLPSYLISLIFGEKGQALLLSSQRVEPSKLLKIGFQFSYSQLKQALCHLLE